MTTSENDQARRSSPSPAIIAVVAVGLVIAFAAVWHVAALSTYARSFEAAVPLEERAQNAQRAMHLEPWNPEFVNRSVVMAKWLHGSVLLSQDAALPAMLELQEAYRLDVGDQELLAVFKKAQRALTVDSNFKAHIQHAHEGPGGTLRPQDLMR